MAEETTNTAQPNEPAAAVASMPTEPEVMNALKSVYDPELGLSIVDLAAGALHKRSPFQRL